MNNYKKVYTIRYSKSGIYQYADFYENENGELINPNMLTKYQKEQNDVSKAKTIKEVLSIIKKYSYNKKAKIWLINRKEPSIKRKELNKINDFSKEIKNIYNRFFNETILPLVPEGYEFQYGDFVIEKEGKSLEETNPNLFRKINHLAYNFLFEINIVKKNHFDNESGYEENYLTYFY